MKLFDGNDSDNEDISKIEIDKDFARRYEHNKKREDLHRLQELQKQGLISPDSDLESSSDDEDDSLPSDDDSNKVRANGKDLEFFNALIKVRNQDPTLKEKNTSLFQSDDDDSENEEEGKQKTKQKQNMYLKDVVAKHLIEEGPDFDDDDDIHDDKKKKKSYNEEQEEVRQAFLKAASDGEEDGEFMKIKQKGDGADMDDDTAAAEFQKKLDEYFGREESLDENKMFLKEYFSKKLWVDKDRKEFIDVDDDEIDELLLDEEEIEKQEDYETNYRHEENVGDRVLGHSRTIDGSVRKKDKARKNQRQSKENRMKNAELGRKEELKHLKNMKKEEMKEKLDKIKKIAGIDEEEDCPLDGDDLDDEFDPEEYDRMMKVVFGDKYYDAEDVNPEFGSDDDDIEKPVFDKEEDELLGLPKGWDTESRDGFSAARERSLKHKVDVDDVIDNNYDDDAGDDRDDDGGETNATREDEEGEGEEEEEEEGKRKRKRKLSLVKRAKEAMMEEYYKLDYEDTIGDLKTRYKYAKTKPNRYGLSTAEIMMIDDKELNQYVSLKKITPYREKEWKVPNNQRYQFKMEVHKKLLSKRKRHREDGSKVTNKKMTDEANGGGGGGGELSKQDSKRRRRQARLKLPDSRLIAYGKITPSSKSKSKTKKH